MFIRSIVPCFMFASLVAAVLAGSAGCQLFRDPPKWPKKLFGKEEETVVPTRMMVMWADTVLHQPQKAGVRGFGARIYFYSEDGPDPVKVDGGLAVYAFDADDLDPKSTKPKRKFVFTADQFAEYMSHTSMGTSYSVWCPWDEVGGYNEQLSLIVRFEGRNGGVVISDATVKLLPGLNKPANLVNRSKPSQGSVTQAVVSGATQSSNQLAGYKKTTAGATGSKSPRRQTQTIDLPPSFYRHLKGPLEPQSPELQPDAAEPVQPRPAVTTATKSSAQRASFPRRTLGDHSVDRTARDKGHHSLPAGWIPALPKTPRYGYPNDRDTNSRHSSTQPSIPELVE